MIHVSKPSQVSAKDTQFTLDSSSRSFRVYAKRSGRFRLFASGILLVLMTGLMVACQSARDARAVDPGTVRAIQNKGSDTLVNIALAWAETYRDVEPAVSIAVTGSRAPGPGITRP